MHHAAMESARNKINICQPGYNASCALCCGSHNYAGDESAIAEIFRERDASPEPRAYPMRFSDGIQCPHAGFIDVDGFRIGCRIYADLSGARGMREFFNYTCKNFSCAARDTLSDDEIVFAARLMGDWFYYSLFINEIRLLKKYYAKYGCSSRVPRTALEDAKKKLHAMIA